MASQYDPLHHHLTALPRSQGEVKLSFADIETILGLELPTSAHQWDAWWGSDPNHAQAPAWLNAGFTASPDRKNHLVRFRRTLG